MVADRHAQAEELRRLHHGPHPLVLPNAWDVPSARTFEAAGFPAIATTSAGIATSLGYRDGEEIPRREFVAAIRRIASKLSVPLSADLVAGFGRTPRGVVATVRAAVAAGAVGVNLEDEDPRGSGLLPTRAQEGKIRAVRALGESLGVPIVINARTDALYLGSGTPEERFAEATRRALAYRDAGADCVYPMRLVEKSEIARFVSAVRCPVNVMVRPGIPTLAELEEVGVKRVSFGPAAAYATAGLLRRIGEEVRARGSFETLLTGAITYDELNALAGPAGLTKS